MLCPVDGSDLLMTERNGVEIDYCPKCRGVWLDRGELDKIIERTSQAEQSYAQRRAEVAVTRGRYDDDDDDYVYDEYSGKRKREHYESEDDYRKRKRRGFLGEIFDILD